MRLVIRQKGGPGSGFRGHAGRPGMVGGSQSDKIGTYGPFGNDKEKFDIANAYIRGKYRHEENPRPEYPWSIHRERSTAAEYAKSYQIEERGGLSVWEHGYYDENGEYVKGYEFMITPEQFNYIYDQVKQESDARYKLIRDAMGMPETFEEFVSGAADVSPYNLPIEQYDELTKPIISKVQSYIDNLEAAGFKATDVSESELTQVFDTYWGQKPQDDSRGGWIVIGSQYVEQWQEFEVKHAVALGDITPEYGGDVGVSEASSPQGNGKWEDLPKRLYHATTNADAIVNDQIRSRREIGQWSGLGLGGGEDDTISFGESEEVVQYIERAVHEAHLVASGKMKIRDMFQLAADGGGGVGKNWAKYLVGFIYGESSVADVLPDDFDPLGRDYDKLPYGMKELLELESGQREYKPSPGWQTEQYPNLDTYLASKRWDIYHLNFGNARQYNGGYMDPLFFGTDYKGLAKADPDQFATLVYSPKPKARGYQLSSLSEWRTVGGDVVDLEKVIDYYKTDDYEAILGWDGLSQ